MHRNPAPPPHRPPGTGFAPIAAVLRRPQVFLPLAVVLGMMLFAFGVQPGGKSTVAEEQPRVEAESSAIASPSAPASTSPTATATRPAGTTTAAASTATASQTPGATNDVAGVRSTAVASATPEEDFSRTATECGAIQETATGLNVEQNINGVAIRATRAAAYPIEYFRCILMATGGREAVSLATSISKAQRDGSTHAVLIDLWITNAGRDFGQVNLKTASLAAAGQVFAPLATLGGRAEAVVSSGQGRNVTLVVALTNGVGATTGPMTLTIDAPLIGGKALQGKYQLFLPTP